MNQLAKGETQEAQVVVPLVSLVNARLEADKRIAELESELKPLKEAKANLNTEIMEEFKRRGEFSTKIEGATVSYSVRKTAVVTDEQAVIEQLKAANLHQYVSESLNELFDEPKKLIAEGKETLLPGMEIRETEFISIRKNDKKDPRKLVSGEFKKIES